MMRPFVKWRIALIPMILFAWPKISSAQQQPSATVIVNARIADGTGKPLRRASGRITGDRIVKIGNFQPTKDEQNIDPKGLVLAPGFLDIHNHSPERIQRNPPAQNQIAP